MKYCNYRISFTKIFTYTGSLSVLSLFKLQGTITLNKMLFPPSICNEQENGSREITLCDITSHLINLLPRLPAKKAERRTLQPWYFKDGIKRQQRKEADYHIFFSFISKRKSVRFSFTLLLIFQRKKKIKKSSLMYFKGKIGYKCFNLGM